MNVMRVTGKINVINAERMDMSKKIVRGHAATRKKTKNLKVRVLPVLVQHHEAVLDLKIRIKIKIKKTKRKVKVNLKIKTTPVRADLNLLQSLLKAAPNQLLRVVTQGQRAKRQKRK